MKKVIIAIMLAGCAALFVAQPVLAAQAAAETETVQAPINVNVASEDELKALPGIGPVTAQRIVADRSANGPYTSVDDLTRVKGIGSKLLEKIRPLVTI